MQPVGNSWLPRFDIFDRISEVYPCQVNEISITREFSTNIVESKYEYITSGIMGDVFNCYGLWKCPLFDDEGNLEKKVKREKLMFLPKLY